MHATAYSTDAHGIIRDHGKFEGEPSWAPYFWDAILNGCCDHDYQDEPGVGAVFFVVSEGDRMEFPELANVYGVGLAEDSQGFVASATYDTAEEFSRIISIHQQAMADESDDNSL